MKFLFCLMILFSCSNAFAQDLKYSVSDPVDISQSGYDRLVQLKNGNTMLFHFENRKGILVKVFDQQRKEIASYKELCKIVDINTLDRATLEEIFGVGNEAVLLIEQDIDNRQTLVRLRFSSETGKLISEEKLVRSESFAKPTHMAVLKSNVDDRYHVVCAKEKKGFVEKEMFVTVYNEKHEAERTVPITIDQKGYDAVTLDKATIDKSGNVIASVILSKIVKFPTEIDRQLVVCYLPQNSQQFAYKKVQLPQMSHLDMKSTYNPFNNSINVLFTLLFFDEVKNAKGTSTVHLSENMLMLMDPGTMSMNFTKFVNDKVRNYVVTEIDTNQYFSGTVMDMHTNQYGLTTLIIDGYTKHVANIGMKGVTGLRHNISFCQLDDKGNELFGKSVPVSRLTSHNVYPGVLRRNNSLASKDCFNTKSNFYVAFNEVEKNFDLKLSEQHDSIYNVDFTNAAYYKLNKKKEITKHYLFGQPVDGEYKHIYPASADFNEKSNTYALLYRHVKAGKPTMHIAWVTAD